MLSDLHHFALIDSICPIKTVFSHFVAFSLLRSEILFLKISSIESWDFSLSYIRFSKWSDFSLTGEKIGKIDLEATITCESPSRPSLLAEERLLIRDEAILITSSFSIDSPVNGFVVCQPGLFNIRKIWKDSKSTKSVSLTVWTWKALDYPLR